MDLVLVAQKRFADKAWDWSGTDYAGLNWLDDSPKPTKEELEALWPDVEYEIAYAAVERARQIAYRETSDPIFFEYQRGDATEAEWLAAVQAVKDAHPYPVR